MYTWVDGASLSVVLDPLSFPRLQMARARFRMGVLNCMRGRPALQIPWEVDTVQACAVLETGS